MTQNAGGWLALVLLVLLYGSLMIVIHRERTGKIRLMLRHYSRRADRRHGHPDACVDQEYPMRPEDVLV